MQMVDDGAFVTQWDMWSDDQKVKFLESQMFENIRKMSDGYFVATMRLAFTTAICVGPDHMCCYEYRWCFKDKEVALRELAKFDSLTHVPERHSYVAHRYLGVPLAMEYDEYGLRRW